MMNAALELGGGESIPLHPYTLAARDHFVRNPAPEAEGDFHAWLIGRFAKAIDARDSGQPVLMCKHLLAVGGALALVYWFPAFPGVEVCRACGEKVRAKLVAMPCPLSHCDVCEQDVPLGDWLTVLSYDGETWCSTAMCCQACTRLFGYMPAEEMIAAGIEDLKIWANRKVTDD